MPRLPLVVGFDLDMTLIDSRPGTGAVLTRLMDETGVFIDVDLVLSRLGPPLEVELANWFPPDQVSAVADRFRALYPELGIDPTPPMPGAHDALAAVHRHAGRAVVVTGKYEPNARLHLDHLQLPADAVEGWRWGEGKAAALGEHGASIYLGDHQDDMRSAKSAGVVAIGVPTGADGTEALLAAGADVVLPDLASFPGWLDEHLLDLRLADLDSRLQQLGSVLVAFSGGADSAFLLAASVRALGPYRVVAATAVSDALAEGELAQAREFAESLGIKHLAPRTYELAREGYRRNEGDRCYFCKAELLDVLVPLATQNGASQVVTGTNADDAAAGFRPGIRAAAERGAATPLLDAGLTKSQIRLASRRWGLATWDKPAAACLSSRIAYGIEVTPGRLSRVDRAEHALRIALDTAGIAVTDMRVRDLGDHASVEVDPSATGDVADCGPALAAVLAEGFDEVRVDPRGFRSGSMNELLTEPERFR